MNQKKYLTYGGIAIIIFALGIVIGSAATKRGENTSLISSTNTYQAGWDAAKKRLSETGYAFPVMAEIKTVSGAVQDIQSDGMTVKIRPLEPLADPALDMRNVKFDANTTFYQIEQKDPIKYQEEVKAFNSKMKANLSVLQAAPGTAPQPFIRKTIAVNDIKIGMTVTISAANNIKEAKEFNAMEITVQSVVVPTAVPTLIPR